MFKWVKSPKRKCHTPNPMKINSLLISDAKKRNMAQICRRPRQIWPFLPFLRLKTIDFRARINEVLTERQPQKI